MSTPVLSNYIEAPSAPPPPPSFTPSPPSPTPTRATSSVDDPSPSATSSSEHFLDDQEQEQHVPLTFDGAERASSVPTTPSPPSQLELDFDALARDFVQARIELMDERRLRMEAESQLKRIEMVHTDERADLLLDLKSLSAEVARLQNDLQIATTHAGAGPLKPPLEDVGSLRKRLLQSESLNHSITGQLLASRHLIRDLEESHLTYRRVEDELLAFQKKFSDQKNELISLRADQEEIGWLKRRLAEEEERANAFEEESRRLGTGKKCWIRCLN